MLTIISTIDRLSNNKITSKGAALLFETLKQIKDLPPLLNARSYKKNLDVSHEEDKDNKKISTTSFENVLNKWEKKFETKTI